MQTVFAIQYIEHYPSEESAIEGLEFLRTQDDFLGGRILPASPFEPRVRTQVFFKDTPEAAAKMPLPDGCRRVLAIVGRCGFTA